MTKVQASTNARNFYRQLLCACIVLEVLLWWKLNWNPWVLVAMFVAGCRGSFLAKVKS